MAKYNFDTAAKYAVDSEKKAGNLWNNLAGYIGELAQFHDVENVKSVLKNREKEYADLHKVKLSSIGAYRSAKSVAIKAVSLGVALLNDNGDARGKTEVEKDIKDNKEDKPVIDKIQSTCNTLNSLLDQLADIDEARMALIMIDQLRDKAGVAIGTLMAEEDMEQAA